MTPTAGQVIRAPLPAGIAVADTVTLSYDQRFLRRRRLDADGGLAFMLDLAETTSLQHGDALMLDDGRHILVQAAPEPVLRITAARPQDLPRLAWHIGNRHTPVQFDGPVLVIRDDHVLAAMLERLGATVTKAMSPFAPEGGAYGHGRTLGHSHGPAETEVLIGTQTRDAPVQWLMRQPAGLPPVDHALPDHGPFDDPPDA